jgi:hypothetical protein
MENNPAQREGKVAWTLEDQTAKIPSDVYLWTAVGTMVISLSLLLGNKKHLSLFFGQWAPSLLIIGLYNKLVKVGGHDMQDNIEKKEKQGARETSGRAYQQFE